MNERGPFERNEETAAAPVDEQVVNLVREQAMDLLRHAPQPAPPTERLTAEEIQRGAEDLRRLMDAQPPVQPGAPAPITATQYLNAFDTTMDALGRATRNRVQPQNTDVITLHPRSFSTMLDVPAGKRLEPTAITYIKSSLIQWARSLYDGKVLFNVTVSVVDSPDSQHVTMDTLVARCEVLNGPAEMAYPDDTWYVKPDGTPLGNATTTQTPHIGTTTGRLATDWTHNPGWTDQTAAYRYEPLITANFAQLEYTLQDVMDFAGQSRAIPDAPLNPARARDGLAELDARTQQARADRERMIERIRAADAERNRR